MRGRLGVVDSRMKIGEALKYGIIAAVDIAEEKSWIYRGTTMSYIIPMFPK